jgi:hypothetical protein
MMFADLNGDPRLFKISVGMLARNQVGVVGGIHSRRLRGKPQTAGGWGLEGRGP